MGSVFKKLENEVLAPVRQAQRPFAVSPGPDKQVPPLPDAPEGPDWSKPNGRDVQARVTGADAGDDR